MERLEKARARLAGVIGARVRVTIPVPCANAAAKERRLDLVTSAGGEGIVLRRAAATWRCGSERRDLLKVCMQSAARSPASHCMQSHARSHSRAAKVKRWLDAEAEVLEFRPAPTSNNLPSLLCRALDPLPRETPTFELSWSRELAPPAVGAIVTFVYRQLQVNGKLSNARLTRVHDPASCDCFHCL